METMFHPRIDACTISVESCLMQLEYVEIASHSQCCRWMTSTWLNVNTCAFQILHRARRVDIIDAPCYPLFWDYPNRKAASQFERVGLCHIKQLRHNVAHVRLHDLHVSSTNEDIILDFPMLGTLILDEMKTSTLERCLKFVAQHCGKLTSLSCNLDAADAASLQTQLDVIQKRCEYIGFIEKVHVSSSSFENANWTEIQTSCEKLFSVTKHKFASLQISNGRPILRLYNKPWSRSLNMFSCHDVSWKGWRCNTCNSNVVSCSHHH